MSLGLDWKPGDEVVVYEQEFPSGVYPFLALERHAPGIEHTEDMARYLCDSGRMAIASDTFSVEVWPPDFSREAFPFGFLHRVLIGQFGMALGELWWLAIK